MTWTGVCCLLACFVRSRMAITEDEMSFRALAWPSGLVSSSGDLEELGCISKFQHLTPTPLPAFPSQSWYPISSLGTYYPNKFLGTRMFPRYCM